MRGTAVFIVAILVLMPTTRSQAQGTQSATPLTVITRDGRRALPVSVVGGRELVALEDVAALFQASLGDDTLAGGATLTYKNRTIVISPDQPMASVDGRVVALPSPLVRSGGRRLVPLEFIPRAVGPIYDQRIDLRRASRLLIIGDLRVPRVTARIDAAGPPTRASVDLVPATPVTITSDNGRIVLDVDADALDMGARVEGTGLIEQIRADQNTIVVVLAPEAGAGRAVPERVDNGTHVAIEVSAAGTRPRDASPAPRPPTPTAPLPLSGSSTTGIQIIAIDPGHGGDDVGVRGARGTQEKQITLDVAQRLRTLIETRLGIGVVMTREDDRTVGIDQRAAIANNSKADLFLSLHVNASPSPAVTGAEIYRLRVDEQVERTRRESEAETVTLPAVGGGTRQIDAIRWDLAQARHVDQSIVLSGLLRQALASHGVAMSERAERQAPLRVLEAADMPAVLIELAYLSNPEQERLAASDAFKDAVAQALYDTIVGFRNQPPAP